jgi:hypothetical protein
MIDVHENTIFILERQESCTLVSPLLVTVACFGVVGEGVYGSNELLDLFSRRHRLDLFRHRLDLFFRRHLNPHRLDGRGEAENESFELVEVRLCGTGWVRGRGRIVDVGRGGEAGKVGHVPFAFSIRALVL